MLITLFLPPLEHRRWNCHNDFSHRSLSLFQALGSGINVQLAQNPLLREIFQLGAVVVEFDKEEMRNAKKQHVRRHCDNDSSMCDVLIFYPFISGEIITLPRSSPNNMCKHSFFTLYDRTLTDAPPRTPSLQIKHAKQSNMMKDMARGKNRDKKMAAMF